MAVLSQSQALATLEKKPNRSKLQIARQQENRIRLHTEAITEKAQQNDGHRVFRTWAFARLTAKDKQERFDQLFTFPVKTNALCDSIFLEFPRALEAQNRYVRSTFTDESLEQDFKDYCEQIGFDDFFKDTGMEALKKYINSFVVVDVPPSMAGERPEPYMYLLRIDYVIDAAVKQDGVCDYISFCQDLRAGDIEAKVTARAVVFDDMSIRHFKQGESGIWEMETEVAHNLGECPVFKFYADLVSKSNPFNSSGPITNSLADLDSLLFDKIAVEYYKAYGMFPIYWGYKQSCSYIDETVNGTCDGSGRIGWFEESAARPGVYDVPRFKDCPKCAAKRIYGPGTLIEIDQPRSKEEADLREPFGFVGVDTDALNFAKDDVAASELFITYTTTGNIPSNVLSKEAVNEMQVAALTESRQVKTARIGKNFSTCMYWAYYFLAKFRYGEYYHHTTVDLGDEYFLRSVADLNKDYTDTRAAGRPAFELAAKRNFIYLTKYRNNPEQMLRFSILENLEPYQDYAVNELNLLGVKQIDPIGYLIKLNFYEYITRFERENLPITMFGSKISFNKKIAIIFDTLKSYANEQLQEANRPDNPFAQAAQNGANSGNGPNS